MDALIQIDRLVAINGSARCSSECRPVTPEVAGSSPARSISLDDFRFPPVDQADDETEVSELKNNHCKNSPAERLPDGASCHVGPDRNDERRCEHAHQKLRKIHNGPAPNVSAIQGFGDSGGFLNRHLRARRFILRSSGPQSPPGLPGAMDAPGVADSAIAVPDTVTHYRTSMPMAQDPIAD
ncbi:hypothetical protein [Mesorhizobium caraganae]|uniref:hypothetical protein n=1 Tax=Mesorhizobium caraganae TaxID=483206 RepID=UPI0028A20670|nr:hypothetical protein [Mesorhizobium caraganae]